MKKEQIEILGEYIKARTSTILIEEIPESIAQKGAVIIEADCSNAELMGKFQELEYKEPLWIKKLKESAKEHIPILIIKDINKIPEKEQRKFIELLKYRKIYTNKIPKGTMIFATYSNLKEKPIEKEVYSFMIQI